MKKLFSFSLECNELAGTAPQVTVGGETDPATIVDETSTQDVASDVLELQERTNDIEQMSTEAGTALDDIESLDAVAQTAEDSIETGGMTGTAANLANLAVEAICERLCIKRTKAFGIATESFSKSETRVQATKVAVEDIKDLAARAWETLKKFIKSIIVFVKETYAKVKGYVFGISKRAKLIQQRAKDFKGTQPEEVTKPGLAAKLSIDGKAVPKDLASNITALGSGLSNLDSDLGKANVELLYTLNKINNSTGASAVDVMTMVNNYGDAFESRKKVVLNIPGFSEDSRVSQIGGVILGDKVMYLEEVTKPNGEVTNVLLHMRDNWAREVDTSETLDVVNTNEIGKITQAVIKLADDKRYIERGTKTLDELQRIIEANSRRYRKEADKAAFAIYRRMLKDTINNASIPVTSYLSAAIKSTHAALDYCDLCMRPPVKTEPA